MDSVLEDALVEWYVAECVTRSASSEARRGDVIDLDSVRPRQNAALARLFNAVEKTVAGMSLIQPAADRSVGMAMRTSESRAHA